MYNMLVVEDNTFQSHLLINCISKELPEIRLCHISTTGIDAINTLKTEIVDIILLDLKLADNISGIDFINFIVKNNLFRYKQSIIIVTGEMNLLNQVSKNPYIYEYTAKSLGINKVIENLKQLLKQKKEEKFSIDIKSKINSELRKLNFDFSYIGTNYLSECIYEIYTYGDWDNINLNKYFYPIIAKRYNKSSNNIKCNIFQSYNNMYYDCSEKYLEKYLNTLICNKKPKLKDIIVTILKKL